MKTKHDKNRLRNKKNLKNHRNVTKLVRRSKKIKILCQSQAKIVTYDKKLDEIAKNRWYDMKNHEKLSKLLKIC